MANSQMRTFLYDYDSESDSLFLYDPKSKSKSSIEIDDLVIDFNVRKEVSGIELLNASTFFKSIKIKNNFISKEILKTITSSKVKITSKENFIVLVFMLEFKSKDIFEAPIYIPQIHESSPAIARIH